MNTKRPIETIAVSLLDHTRDDRGMTVVEWSSRCVRRGDLHEIVTTDQANARPGDRIDRVGFVGFVEVLTAGVIDVGDRLVVNERAIGRVIGFDECHFPNHYNILIECNRLWTARSLDIGIDERLVFRP
jgi:hypothetical protein